MKEINTKIVDELRVLVNKYGSARRLAEAVGVSHAVIDRALSGEIASFSSETWEKLLPLVSATCHMGYQRCPFARGEELEKLLKKILENPNPKWYNHLSAVVDREREKFNV